MIPDATFGPLSANSRRLRLRFSLLALFLFITLVCLLLAWWVQPNRMVATALFRVSSVRPTILGDESAQGYDEQEYEVVKKTQLAFLKSSFVLNSALRKPGIASLPIFSSQADPAEWLEENLEVSYPHDGEILEIRLRGPEAQVQDLVRIVDAVAKAYQDEVVYKERSRQLGMRDLLNGSHESLNKDLLEKAELYADVARESEVDANSTQMRQLNLQRLERVEAELMRLENEQLQLETSGAAGNSKFFEIRIAQLRERQADLEETLTSGNENSVELATREKELERLQGIVDDISKRLETMEIDDKAPPRIELVQPAVPSPAE